MKLRLEVRKSSKGGKVVIKGEKMIEIIFSPESNFKSIELEFDENDEKWFADTEKSTELKESEKRENADKSDQFEESERSENAAESDELEKSERSENTAKPAELEESELHENKTLEKIASESENFEEFVDKVAASLNLGKREEFFKSLVYAAIKMEKISWEGIKDSLDFSDWDKIWVSKQVTNLFGMKILNFVKEIKLYKERFNTFDQVDKFESTEQKVKHILETMNFGEVDDGQVRENILEIVNAAMNTEFKTIEEILEKTTIPKDMWHDARMQFSSFINKSTRMKVIDFLRMLKT